MRSDEKLAERVEFIHRRTAEANPNVARDDYFSDSAKKSGLDYEPLLQNS